MRVFVTGATGLIGSALVPKLLSTGHEVLALARSDASATRAEELGALVVQGSLEDREVIAEAARQADGVIHLAFDHELMFNGDMVGAAALDRSVIEVMADALEGTGRPLVIAGGVLRIDGDGSVLTEDVEAPGSGGSTKLAGEPTDRTANARFTLALARRGIRSVVVRLAPIVHGDGQGGFLTPLVLIAQATSVSGYAGDGRNRWPAAHVSDIATLFRLGLEGAPAGTVLHGVGEEGIALRSIAAAIGERLELPVRSIEPEHLFDHFGRFSFVIASDCPASNDATRALLGWEPTGVGLIEDIGNVPLDPAPL
jgi:nucleoside-diphosphate-sugar epimerase